MSSICLSLLLASIATDTAEARRSRDRHSHRFYREFYEKHKDAVEQERPKRRFRLHAFEDEHSPLPYADCEAIAENGWGTRRIVKWVCIGDGK
jgi:hypothetical protein